jgi:hypothetical protein
MFDEKRLNELALIGLRRERDAIDLEIKAIESQLTSTTFETASDPAPETVTKRPRVAKVSYAMRPRQLSDEARRRLSLVAKRRWKQAHREGRSRL